MNYANIVLKSDSIFTGETNSLIQGGIAIRGNKIMAVGPNNIIDTLIGSGTNVYEFGDKLIMPGFIDAHFHLFMGAVINSSKITCTELIKSTSEEECVKIIKEFAEEHPGLDRIRGVGWFPANWKNKPLPTRKLLDAAIPDKPVYLICADGHTHWLNTKALEECNITKDTCVSFGEIGKDKNGDLTGILLEIEACAISMEKFLDLSDEEMKIVLIDLLEDVSKYGITSLCDLGISATPQEENHPYEILRGIELDNKLTSRVFLYPILSNDTDLTNAKKLKGLYKSDKMQVAGLKQFIDGVTSTYSGYLLEPYTDKPDTCGFSNSPKDIFEKCAIHANANDFSVRFHAVGDAAVRMALDIFEESKRINCNKHLKNSIEHCENIHPDDIERFYSADVVASLQPYHLTLDFNEKLLRIGMERSKFEWPHNSILEKRGTLAFGTDFPVVSYNPFPNIYSALTRCDDEGNPTGVNPWEAISLPDVLRAYTYGGACSHNKQDILGQLKEGMIADIIVLDRNLFSIPDYEIPETNVILTIMDGEVISG